MQTKLAKKYPSEVIPFMEKWKILLGDGTRTDSLLNFEKEGFFYVEHEDNTNWVVYKTPNSGITSPNSSNTRTELGQKKRWIPKTGGKLTGTLKVQHVSTSGDATVSSSYSVVVGQIHSDEGHENEPLKIFYKKFPGHKKGSVFWNYEINTKGSNDGRWDYSTAVWGYDFSVVGSSPNSYPDEPEDGIALGEEFSYEVNVFEGVMYLTFISDGHETKTFTKNLLKSDFTSKRNIPQQVIDRYSLKRRVGIELDSAYTGEKQFFKQGAYNQANGKSTKSETYGGDISKQYANGSYAEVWFKKATVGEGSKP
ncbi:polysaccharide lyase family 7 protein [Seonamhaeicola sp. NFXS20]|uniref:polysaccharide lyase family 7 protein n=1 Tax=Seonamhaeicola sp. NFXS20 TaxID=2816959 RepID=UPI003B8DD3FD